MYWIQNQDRCDTSLTRSIQQSKRDWSVVSDRGREPISTQKTQLQKEMNLRNSESSMQSTSDNCTLNSLQASL